MAAFLRFLVLLALADAAFAAGWGCYGTKPGHPTPAERTAFVTDVSNLAIAAEKKHGVPATGLAALAIAESGYGWTRLALEANNLFGWKFVRSEAKERRSHVPACQRGRVGKDRYAIFASRAEAFDVVAAKLATLDAYREYTDAYKGARKRGAPIEPAVNAWIAGIATRYSRKPGEFAEKMMRIINDPEQRGTTVPSNQSLYELSRKASTK